MKILKGVRTFLLTSKPETGKCDETRYEARKYDTLSIYNNRTLAQLGDRFLHLKQGKVAGIVAVGRINSEAFEGHFAAKPAIEGYFVKLKADASINPYKEPYMMITREELIRFWPVRFSGRYPWAPLSSGSLVPEPEATLITEAFLRRVKRQSI